MQGNFPSINYALDRGSPEASSNPPPASYPLMKSYQSLHLKQISSKAQIVTFDQPHPTHPTYNIETTSTSFLGHKPDLAISREHNKISQKVAQGNFEKYNPVSKIKYRESNKVEELRLENHHTQRVIGTIDGMPWGWWQPSQVDNLLIEILAPSNELIARFVYSNDHIFSDKVIKFSTVLGELQVDEQYASNQTMLDQVVCTTVTLIEREKRRQHKLRGEEGTAPVASLEAGIAHAGDLEVDGPAPPYDDGVIRLFVSPIERVSREVFEADLYDVSFSPMEKVSKSKKSKPEPKSPSPATSSPEIAESEESKSQAETLTAKSSPPPKEDFESYYLKRVTAEFADDIDRLRNAPDFNERSVPVLIAALKGGSKGFSEDEKEKLIKAR
ncbi:MAG: hypothetical protein ASARMPRED_003211 [Alectoria sarmentosa]|nr:MAG: hypothetical protein ASARMPRED_003211 [Alectoria sarmentosa]